MDTPVFDDGSEIVTVIEPDEQPRSGAWVDHEECIGNLTPAEVEEGNRLGLTIDVDDDEDNGF